MPPLRLLAYHPDVPDVPYRVRRMQFTIMVRADACIVNVLPSP